MFLCWPSPISPRIGNVRRASPVSSQLEPDLSSTVQHMASGGAAAVAAAGVHCTVRYCTTPLAGRVKRSVSAQRLFKPGNLQPSLCFALPHFVSLSSLPPLAYPLAFHTKNAFHSRLLQLLCRLQYFIPLVCRHICAKYAVPVVPQRRPQHTCR